MTGLDAFPIVAVALLTGELAPLVPDGFEANACEDNTRRLLEAVRAHTSTSETLAVGGLIGDKLLPHVWARIGGRDYDPTPLSIATGAATYREVLTVRVDELPAPHSASDGAWDDNTRNSLIRRIGADPKVRALQPDTYGNYRR